MSDNAMQDLARLRAIAEEGRRLPLLGGRILILWGCAIAVASLVQGAIVAGWLAWPPISIAAIWAAVMIVAGVASRAPAMLHGGGSGHDLANRLERAVWRTGGTFLAVLAAAVFVTGMVRLDGEGDPGFFGLFSMLPPVMFGVYALALRTAAVASSQTALRPYVWLSLAFAVVTVSLAWTVWQMPATALGALVVSVLPGIVLVRIEGRVRG